MKTFEEWGLEHYGADAAYFDSSDARAAWNAAQEQMQGEVDRLKQELAVLNHNLKSAEDSKQIWEANFRRVDNEIEVIKQERDELKAYQISLRSFLIWARDVGATERDFDLALSETPAQSLAEIKIQAAVEDALSLHQQAYGVTEYVNAHDLRQYANQLRNQKEGE